MDSFLKGYEDQILELMQTHKANDVSKNGTQIRRTMCPLGINVLTLQEVRLKNSKGLLWIQLVYQPQDRLIGKKKEKLAPILVSVFRPDEIGVLYDHEFRPRPADMPNLEYMQHVCRRMMTWVGREISVGIGYDKSILRDNYSKILEDGVGSFRAVRMAYYPRITTSFSWDTAIQMSPRDEKDYKQWLKDNK